MTARKGRHYDDLRKRLGLQLTCASAFPGPSVNCGKAHASEEAAWNHSRRLEALRMEGKAVDGRKAKKGFESSVLERSPFRPAWVNPAMLGDSGAVSDESEPRGE